MADKKITLDSRGALQDFIAEKAANDPKYREALLANPKKLLESQVGSEMPEGFNVKVVEETPDTMYLIAPHVPKPSDELSDEDLEQVAGGILGGLVGGLASGLGSLFGGGGGGGRGGGGGSMCERNYGSFNSSINIAGDVSSSGSGDVTAPGGPSVEVRR